MNRQRVVTSLEGYDGPIFPGPVVDELNTAYEAVGAEADWKRIANFKSFEKIDFPTTEDSCNWFGLSFEAPEGRIVVLFPKIGDQEKLDGVALDRSIATYKSGKVPDHEVILLLQRLHLGFLEDENLRYLEKRVATAVIHGRGERGNSNKREK